MKVYIVFMFTQGDADYIPEILAVCDTSESAQECIKKQKELFPKTMYYIEPWTVLEF